ncbi:MAG: NUDIX hydrolase [Chloroflexi bacterium]|nr:NUDIX hydrolase [Chloroflexota bacterium]
MSTDSRPPANAPSTRRREGSAVILFDAAGRVLLQQRDDDIPPAGYGRWAIPGGGREGEESPRDTALREFEEETGISLKRLRFFRTLTSGEIPELQLRTLHLFFADDAVDPASIQVNEGLDFRFWSPAEARQLPMNAGARTMLEWFLASDQYTGTLALHAEHRTGVCLVELDRWGRVLLQLRDDDLPADRYPGAWSLPGGMMHDDESPDAAVLREFEEETGVLLDGVKLYRTFRKDVDLPESFVHVQHVYYIDGDIDEDQIDVREGQAFRYFTPAEALLLGLPGHTRHILEGFFVSPAYKGMFH